MEGLTVSHYRILEKIGEGGMGEVYLAEDTSLKRKVAVKFLPAYLAEDEVAHRRFLREAESAAALDHPFICNIHEIGESEGKRFIVMEYVKGQTLREKLLEGPVPLKQTLQIGMEIAEALEAAHKAGIAHRDLKPANIMLTSGGHAKVMDFGLAKKVVDKDGTEQDITSALTREGTTLGTLAYMSPEQLRGKPVDTRTDIFSFGIVLYELLAGIHPFRKPKQVETTDAILREDPSPLSRYTEDTSEVLQHTIAKMLAKDPDLRYQSVHEVRTNLNSLSEKLSVPDVTPAPVRMKRSIWLGAGALFLAVVALVLTLYLYQTGPEKVEEAPIDSIAVLPFTSIREDEDSESLADGIPAFIGSSLMRLERLKVKPAAVLARYKGQEIDPQTVAEEQNVRAVLMGNVAKRGDSLAVEVYVIDGKDNTQIWSQPYTRPTGDIFAVQEDIARQVAGALRLRLTETERESLTQSGTTKPDAYQAFLRGRYHLGRSGSDREQKNIYANAIHYLEKAIEIDPRYQEAYASLLAAYFHRARTTTLSEEDYAKAREYAAKLVEVDDSTALAHRVRARILWMYDRKWKEADREYRRATELDPTLETDPGFLMWLGSRGEALAIMESGLEQADPLSALQQGIIGWGFLFLREFDRAAEQANKVLALEPESFDAYTILSVVYQQLGMEERAFEAYAESQRIWGVAEDEVARLREVFEKSGWQGVWRWELEGRLKGQLYPRPQQTAGLYAELGEKDKAFEWLEKAWSTTLWGNENAPSSYYWDPLRDDPRFEQLLRNLHLPEEAIQRHLAVR